MKTSDTAALRTRSSLSVSRTALLAVAIAAFGAAKTLPAQELTIFTDKPAYEVAQFVTLTVQGPPGAPVTILIDVDDGPTFVPGFGEFALSFTPAFLMADLGVIPPSGEFDLTIPFLCRFAPILGFEIYLQAVAFGGPEPILSNPWHFTQSPGDCSDECVAGIEQMAVQTTFHNVPATGKLEIQVKRPNGQQTVYGTFDMDLVLAADATGVLDVPLVNADGSIVVSILEQKGSSLAVRFCVDAKINGKNEKLQGGNTRFSATFAGTNKTQEIHTSCSQPLAVGDVFGDYIVTKLIFVDP